MPYRIKWWKDSLVGATIWHKGLLVMLISVVDVVQGYQCPSRRKCLHEVTVTSQPSLEVLVHIIKY